ncbi:Jerky protein, partial [Operophtera brumata]
MKMVRNYKRKTENKYTQENLLKALEDVRSNKLNTYQAADVYGVPRSTLVHRLRGSREVVKSYRGRPTVFTKYTETKIPGYIHIMEKTGFPLTVQEVKVLISDYIKRNGFRSRNNLSLKKPQSVETARRKACNPFIVYNYYDLLQKTQQELELTAKPQNIYNLDETSFCCDPSKAKVMGQVGYRSTRTTSSPGRDNTTVLLAANALGGKIPPLISFPGEWVYQDETVNTAYAVSRKGWMETSIFEKYIKDVFIPAIGSERPVLLIYDGHSTHCDLSVIELAVANGITILKLPPHSSHILQPLDCSTMKPLKDRWESELIKWQRLHVGAKLPKSEFARILTNIWDNLNP